eukprot:361525-Chlamydomonas_euryale.AAC.12
MADKYWRAEVWACPISEVTPEPGTQTRRYPPRCRASPAWLPLPSSTFSRCAKTPEAGQAAPAPTHPPLVLGIVHACAYGAVAPCGCVPCAVETTRRGINGVASGPAAAARACQRGGAVRRWLCLHGATIVHTRGLGQGKRSSTRPGPRQPAVLIVRWMRQQLNARGCTM